ncbi:MAG: histidine phosphatase family protein [Pseudomonadota bacterium]
MDLILWRHAEAEEGELDLERRLTPKGHKQARRMATWLGSQLPESCKILVSPAQRALQTVAPLGRKFKVVPALAPNASAQDILHAANWPKGRAAVLLVGHQPTLGQAAALLLCGQVQDWNIKKGNIWWIAQSDPLDPASRFLRAVMAPKLIVK